MKVKFRFYLLVLMAIIALLVATSCDCSKPEPSNIVVKISPPDKGNFVYIYAQEWIDLEGNLKIWEGEPEIYRISSQAGNTRISLSTDITKIRAVAVPGPGYKFDHWGGNDASGTTDYVEFAIGHGRTYWIEAYFVPLPPGERGPSEWETPLDTGPEQPDTGTETQPSPLEANVWIISETIEDETGCSSVMTINYEAVDLSRGDRPIAYIQLNVDGDELTSWSGTPTTTEHYQDSTSVESGCSEVHFIQLTAVNNEGTKVTAAKEAKIPPLSTHFEWDISDVSTAGKCQMQLVINYQAVDVTPPDNPITNVVVKVNGQVLDNSGIISTDWYEDSLSALVGCGNIYTIEVIGTDADNNKYTYRETIRIPEAEPTDELPPPPTPPPSPQETLYAALAAGAQCTTSGLECSCQLSVSLDGKDLTNGDYPVTHVVLRVNGQIWHDSGTISTTHYHHTETKTVDCGETFSLRVDVNNSIGQTVTSTGSITTPIP